MSGDFKHLELVLKKSGIRRRKKNEIPPTPEQVKINKKNRGGHSQFLSNKATSQIKIWNQSDEDREKKNLPKLPKDKALLIKIPPEEVDLDFLRTTLNFEVICEFEEGFVIVATDPDVFLKNINEKIEGFAQNIRGTGNISKIYDIVIEETKDERLKRILSEELYINWNTLRAKESETIVVELSIECLGTVVVPKVKKEDDYANEDRYRKAVQRWEKARDEAYMEWDDLCLERQGEIEKFISDYNGNVLAIFDSVDDHTNLDSFEMKIEVPIKCLIDLAENYPYIFEITLPEEFDINLLNANESNVNELKFELKEPEVNAPTVCVVDSGIQEDHLYLSKAIRGDISKNYLVSKTSAIDEVEPNGHGTRVAGAVLYPDEISNLSGSYTLPCFIANARVLDEQNGMPIEMLPSKVINDIVKDYNKTYGIKIFNHSIASSSPCRKKYMSSWATSIDNVSFENDVLFLQSAGNLSNNSNINQRLGIRQHLDSGRTYPAYLLENSCRIANPAQSTQALTVGSVCYGDFETNDLISFGKKGAVSSFSRCGFGMWSSIKPEVVEYGGDWIRSKHNNTTFIINEHVCPELIRRSPQGPAYAKDDIGTSFSTPKVANIASQLQKSFPHRSGLLYKSLIVQSARWTEWANNFSEDEKINVLRYMGYGFPDIERATTNDEYRITFITSEEKEVKGGNVHVYKVKIPDEIKVLNAEIRIDVTLAFSAKPRRTRKDFKNYFSTWVDWESSKSGENVDDFSKRVIQLENDVEETITSGGTSYTWTIGKRDGWGKIKGINRNKSAIQKDWIIIPAYDLPDDFCIAVIGHNGWSNTGEHAAKYVLTVGFEAINKDVEIYVPFVEVETEASVEQEIETEIRVEEM